MSRCTYILKPHNITCGGAFHSTIIEFRSPEKDRPFVVRGCRKHGDELFNRMMLFEKEYTDENKNNAYDKTKDELYKFRWNSCRKCQVNLSTITEVWNITMFTSSNKFRKAFYLCRECITMEMHNFGVNFIPEKKSATIDGYVT